MDRPRRASRGVSSEGGYAEGDFLEDAQPKFRGRAAARAGREADANGVAKRATNRALVAAMKEVEAASLALKRYDARSARRRARPHVRPPLDLSLDAPVKRKPPTKK